jgi:ADP-ribosylglycohydrolase
MAVVTINRNELKNRIYGCWLGKNIGGTLGGPYEGRREILNVTGFVTPQGEPLPNDDLDLQLIWLKAVQERGPLGVTSAVLGEYWLNYIPPPWNEYGISKCNQRAGLPPPLSGMYDNPWKDSNGAWIRSEIWACLTPGAPDAAIRLAYADASVDHGGAEGMFAELFTAAVQSAAFVVHDRSALIKIGLSKIPAGCRVARSIGIAMHSHSEGLSWQEARTKIVEDSQDLGWFMAPANVAFVIVGWLYGEGDFMKSLLIATNCGDDTDCTAATLGATLGILLGRDGLPQEWVQHLGDRIFTVAIDRGTLRDCPTTLQQLTEQVMDQVPGALNAYHCEVRIEDTPSDYADAPHERLLDDHVAKAIWAKPKYGVEYDFVHTRVTLDFGKQPDIAELEPFELRVMLQNTMPDHRHIELAWMLPDDWEVLPSRATRVSLNEDHSRSITFQVTPRNLTASTYSGILSVTAVGRPTVGLVPLLFINAGR